MNVTELAHWRYRVKAIAEDVQATVKAMDRWRGVNPYEFGDPNFHQQEVDALKEQLDFERWLLEEAKYKVELGEVGGFVTTTTVALEWLSTFLSGVLDTSEPAEIEPMNTVASYLGDLNQLFWGSRKP